MEIGEDEERTQAPGFWDDPKKAEILLKQITEKKRWTNSYAKAESLFEELEIGLELYQSGDADEAEVDQAYKKMSA